MTLSPTRTGLVLRAALGLLSVVAYVNARIGVPSPMATSKTAATRIDSSPERSLQDLDLPPLRTVGNNGGRGFPLGECEGDCDNNRECQDGLICVQRSAGDPVPGCVGSLAQEIDYCVKAFPDDDETETPLTIAPTLQASVFGTPAATQGETSVSPATVAPTDIATQVTTTSSPATVAPTDAVTQVTTLVATTSVPATVAPTDSVTQAATSPATTSPPTFVASGTVFTTAPTLTATAGVTAAATSVGSSASSTEAPIIVTPVPTAPVLPLNTVGNDGNFPAYPLSICEGDCDADADCIGELICFQRIADEGVPGCEGVGDFSIDYCVDPNQKVQTEDRI